MAIQPNNQDMAAMMGAPAQVPAAASVPPPQGNMSPEQFMEMIRANPALLEQAQGAQPAEAQPAPSYGTKLVATKDGGLGVRKPADHPLMALFGMKKTSKIDPTNYFDTLAGSIGSEAATKLLPSNTPITPDGKPFVDASVLQRIAPFMKDQQDASKTPNKSVAKLALATLESKYGKDHPIYQNAAEAIKDGLPMDDLQKFLAPLEPRKEDDFVKGANGLYMRVNRVTGKAEVIPGQTTGILEALNDPATKSYFDKRQTEFDTDKVVTGLKSTLDTLSQASATLESNNPASIGPFFSIIAKSIGKDAGALAEGDVTRAMGGPGIGSRLERFWFTHIDNFKGKGHFSDTDMKDFRGLLQDLGTAADKRYQENLDRHVSSITKTVPGMTKEWVTAALDKAARFDPAKQRRLEGQATGYEKKTEGVTKSGVKFKVIK